MSQQLPKPKGCPRVMVSLQTMSHQSFWTADYSLEAPPATCAPLLCAEPGLRGSWEAQPRQNKPLGGGFCGQNLLDQSPQRRA